MTIMIPSDIKKEYRKCKGYRPLKRSIVSNRILG